MDLKRGPLIDHLHLRTSDLEAARRFYAAILDSFGIEVVHGDDHFTADELWVDAGDPPSNVHLAFQASDREPSTAGTRRASPPAAGTMARPATATITRATTPRSCSIPTATTSKPVFRGPQS